jgi:dimethylargininase
MTSEKSPTLEARGHVAVTHVPSPNMQRYERTYVEDQAIDLALAARQHDAYCVALERCGAEVIRLDVNQEMADCVFVEDTAIVFDDVAVMTSPGAESRRREPAGIEPTLRAYREIERVYSPATIDGGDVVVAGRNVYVGQSPRTNAAGLAALRDILLPRGYRVIGVPVTGCLHLKTACSYLPNGQFLVNGQWIDASPLPLPLLVQVPVDEPWAGDVLAIDNRIIASDAFPRTIELLGELGTEVLPVSVSEFAKAEGGVTCLSLVFKAPGGRGAA